MEQKNTFFFKTKKKAAEISKTATSINSNGFLIPTWWRVWLRFLSFFRVFPSTPDGGSPLELGEGAYRCTPLDACYDSLAGAPNVFMRRFFVHLRTMKAEPYEQHHALRYTSNRY